MKIIFHFLKNTLGENVKISSVVKGNAYGHGEDVFVPLVENCGINHFSVFSAAEALNVKKVVKKKTDVMIMGMIDNEELEWAIENDIEFYIFDLDRFQSALNISKKLKKPAKIHIEIETGMNRTGFNAKSLREVIKLIKQEHKYIKFKGLCTHYAGAESIANFVRIKKQIKHFNKIKKWLNNENMNPEIYHTACSAAAISYPQTRMDMVRIGILQYGFWPSKETLIDYLSHKEDKKDPLRRVISWKSKIMNTKRCEYR